MTLFSRKNQTKEELIEKIILEKYNQYYRLAYSYVHKEEDAYDIVQNGAYKALRSSYTLEKTEYAQTWVYRIMLNECFRYLKQPQFLSYDEIQEEDGIQLGYMEDSYIDVDLERALNELPEKDKAIVIMKYFEDKKIEEIAEILDENTNSVKSRLYRSVRKLHTILSDEKERR